MILLRSIKIKIITATCSAKARSKGVSTSTLLLALVLVKLQNTCKKKLNRKMLERPNVCYIFEKLRVHGCQN